jgi:hypothetical protein
MQYDNQTREDMLAMIVSWQQSGLSQKLYCKQNRIRYHVFHYWYKRYKDAQDVQRDGFVPLNVKPPVRHAACTAAIELLLADGKRILFHQPISSDYLKALIS